MSDFKYVLQLKVEARNISSAKAKMKKVRKKLEKVKDVYVEEMFGSKVHKIKDE